MWDTVSAARCFEFILKATCDSYDKGNLINIRFRSIKQSNEISHITLNTEMRCTVSDEKRAGASSSNELTANSMRQVRWCFNCTLCNRLHSSEIIVNSNSKSNELQRTNTSSVISLQFCILWFSNHFNFSNSLHCGFRWAVLKLRLAKPHDWTK